MRILCFIIVLGFTLSCKEEKMIGFQLEFSKIGTIIYQNNKKLYYLDCNIEDDQIFFANDELSCDTIKMSLTDYEMEKIHNAFLESKIYLFDNNNDDIGEVVDELHTDRNLEKYIIFTDRRKIVVNYQKNIEINTINMEKTDRFKRFHSVLDTIYGKKIDGYFTNKK